jgi:ribosome-interacting GTPase 1
VFVRPYAEKGPIPVLRSRSAVAEFCAELDRDRVEEFRREQVAYMDEEYHPNEDVDKKIARFMRSTSE